MEWMPIAKILSKLLTVSQRTSMSLKGIITVLICVSALNITQLQTDSSPSQVLPFPLCHMFLRMSLMCVSLLMRQIHLNILIIKSKRVPSECGELKRDENFNPFNVRLNFFLSLLLFNTLTFASECSCRE